MDIYIYIHGNIYIYIYGYTYMDIYIYIYPWKCHNETPRVKTLNKQSRH
jgi:hypothetical protein